jgi:hypothetical protein
MQWFKFDPTVVGTIVEDLDLSGQGAYFKLMRSLWVSGPLSEAEVRRKCGPTFEQLRELMCPVGECLSFAWLEALRSEGQHVSDVRAAAATVRHSKQKEAHDMQLHANAMQLPSMSKSSSNSNSESKSGKKERASEPEIIPVGMSADLWSALKRWEQYRVESRKKLTPSGKEALIKQCMAMGDQRAIAAIDHSIAQGWQGMYEPKQATNGQANQSDEQRRAERRAIIAERYAGQ